MSLPNSVVDTHASDHATAITPTAATLADDSAKGIEDSTSHDLRAHDVTYRFMPQEQIQPAQPVCGLHNHQDPSSQAASPEDTDHMFRIGNSPATSASEDTNDSGLVVDGAELIQAPQGDNLPTTGAFSLQDGNAPMVVGDEAFFASPAHVGGTLPAGNVDTYGLHTAVYTPFVHAQIMAAANTNHAYPAVVFEGGQYTSFDVFAGHAHDHIASDLGFVFNHDVFDSNDPGASESAWPSDLGEVFGDVQYTAGEVFGDAQYTAGDVFGADYADSVPLSFESDLGFAF